MTYEEAIHFLFTSLPMFQRVGGSAYKPNLDNTRRLDAYFGHPHRKFYTIHVAGTNGKGSVSHMLAAILQQGGYKTGLYTSPHLLDFRERIRVNGSMISKQEVTDFVNDHKKLIAEISPSFFEMTAAMAFDYFARQQVDIAVIEVGMGGRLDSTNIITPLVSVITNISHDHGQFLGDTLEKISIEKAGIIKPGIPVVIGETQPETEPVFKEVASRKEAPIIFADQRYDAVSSQTQPDGQLIVVRNRDTGIRSSHQLDLRGQYQQKNLKTVLATLDLLNRCRLFILPAEAIENGLRSTTKQTGLTGRWQVLAEKPLVVADTGHNEAGLREVTEQIARTPHNRLFIILGVVNDKDLFKVWPMLPRDASYLFTQAKIDRALDADQLAQQAFDQGFTGEILPAIPDAVQRAKELAAPDDMIFIGGSTFIVAEALPCFGIGVM